MSLKFLDEMLITLEWIKQVHPFSSLETDEDRQKAETDEDQFSEEYEPISYSEEEQMITGSRRNEGTLLVRAVAC